MLLGDELDQRMTHFESSCHHVAKRGILGVGRLTIWCMTSVIEAPFVIRSSSMPK